MEQPYIPSPHLAAQDERCTSCGQQSPKQCKPKAAVDSFRHIGRATVFLDDGGGGHHQYEQQISGDEQDFEFHLF